MLKRYYINTYGCQMNVHESEKLAGILRDRGYVEAADQSDADIILFNTCCIRETAEQHVLGNLGIVKKLKELRPGIVVAVCGCMAQQEGAAERLKKRCPFIDIIFGTHNLHKLGEFLDRLPAEKYISEIVRESEGVVENVPEYRTSGLNAWVNITYGCNNFCSYCIVPYVRGRERSRERTAVIDEVKRLLDEGYKEITLLGQNVNSYGNDFGGKSGTEFPRLLEDLAALPGKFRIKFMTSHPKDLSEDVVKVIASSDKLADFIHLPAQSGSDRILKLMNRKYTSADYLALIDMIRKHIPNAGLSSDIMVGFPTETEEDFADTVRLVERVGYNNLFTFIYSRRSGTPADKMDGQVDIATKKRRIRELIDLQFGIEKRAAAACVGNTYEVFVEDWLNGLGSGETSCGKPVCFRADCDVTGKFVRVKINKNNNSLLRGDMID